MKAIKNTIISLFLLALSLNAATLHGMATLDTGQDSILKPSLNLHLEAILPAPMAIPLARMQAQPTSQLVINDDDFDPIDWQVRVVSATNGASHSVDQPSDGGNPGPYRQMTHTMPPPTDEQGTWLEVIHLLVDQSYTPATQGAITHLDFEFDSTFVELPPCGECNGATYVNTWLVLFQGGRTFQSFANTTTWPYNPAWETHSLPNLGPYNFEAMDGTQDNPDFSSTGGPIYFGFLRRTSRGDLVGLPDGEDLVLQHGMDNFQVTVHSDNPARGPILLAGQVSAHGQREYYRLTFEYSNAGDAAANSALLELELGVTITPLPEAQTSSPGWTCRRVGIHYECVNVLGDVPPGSSGVVFLQITQPNAADDNPYFNYVSGYLRQQADPRPGAFSYYLEWFLFCPTTCSPLHCVFNFLGFLRRGLPGAFGSSARAFAGLSDNSDDTPLYVATYYHIRDDVLRSTAAGRRYSQLFYQHSPDISLALLANPDLVDESVSVLQAWYPRLQMLVEGRGDEVTITSEMVVTVETFLDHLAAAGSPALQQVIAEERARTPLDQFVGMTMEAARAELVGYPTLYLPLINR